MAHQWKQWMNSIKHFEVAGASVPSAVRAISIWGDWYDLKNALVVAWKAYPPVLAGPIKPMDYKAIDSSWKKQSCPKMICSSGDMHLISVQSAWFENQLGPLMADYKTLTSQVVVKDVAFYSQCWVKYTY